jgi:prophage regulatory protein
MIPVDPRIAWAGSGTRPDDAGSLSGASLPSERSGMILGEGRPASFHNSTPTDHAGVESPAGTFKTSLRLTEPADSYGHVAKNSYDTPVPPGFSAGPDPSARLLRFAAVRERVGLSRSTIWRLERSGPFPRHRRISLSAVARSEKEIVEWIQARIGR